MPILPSKIKNPFRISKTAGLIPGSVVHVGKKKVDTVTLQVYSYNQSEFTFFNTENLSECLTHLKDKKTVTWLNLSGLHDVDLITELGESFDLHTLTLEDIANTEQRPKAEENDNYLFFTLKMLEFDGESAEVIAEQVSFVLQDSVLISFQEKPGDVLDPVRTRIKEGQGKVRLKNADYLLYALIDMVIDNYFFIMENMGDKIEELEEEALSDPKPEILEKIQSLKRQVASIRKSVFPLRESLNVILRGESKYIHSSTFKYYRDLYDHTISVIESVETYKEQISSVKDLYLSSLSNKMNNIMKVLTIMASIFIPLTFVAGIYGMNFKNNFPELEWEYGYVYFWSVIIVITILMVWYFKRKGWL